MDLKMKVELCIVGELASRRDRLKGVSLSRLSKVGSMIGFCLRRLFLLEMSMVSLLNLFRCKVQNNAALK